MENLDCAIVTQARTWLGTRFHHQGRLKHTEAHKGGVDCLGLLIGVARELGLKGRDGTPLCMLDSADYGHLPDGTALKAALQRHLWPVSDPQPGDILLIALEGAPRHLGIASLYEMRGGSGDESLLGLIHAYAQARKVVEHPLDAWWRERIHTCFRMDTAALSDNE